jgi:peptidoglycan/xylan/chitin deacetylase (PgdA/CDA1 family)
MVELVFWSYKPTSTKDAPSHVDANSTAFFDENGVKATFFVVPMDEESEKPFYEVFPELPEIIKAARANGHAFGQHGIRHNRFELGVPPAMVLDLPHETENKLPHLSN